MHDDPVFKFFMVVIMVFGAISMFCVWMFGENPEDIMFLGSIACAFFAYKFHKA
jgi:hypothetical protein